MTNTRYVPNIKKSGDFWLGSIYCLISQQTFYCFYEENVSEEKVLNDFMNPETRPNFVVR